jgi:hypothetical protein
VGVRLVQKLSPALLKGLESPAASGNKKAVKAAAAARAATLVKGPLLVVVRWCKLRR